MGVTAVEKSDITKESEAHAKGEPLQISVSSLVLVIVGIFTTLFTSGLLYAGTTLISKTDKLSIDVARLESSITILAGQVSGTRTDQKEAIVTMQVEMRSTDEQLKKQMEQLFTRIIDVEYTIKMMKRDQK